MCARVCATNHCRRRQSEEAGLTAQASKHRTQRATCQHTTNLRNLDAEGLKASFKWIRLIKAIGAFSAGIESGSNKRCQKH